MKPKAHNAKRKASPVSELEDEENPDELVELDAEEDTQMVEGPSKASKKKVEAPEEEGLWIGKAIPKDQAKKFWPHRYGPKEVSRVSLMVDRFIVSNSNQDLLCCSVLWTY